MSTKENKAMGKSEATQLKKQETDTFDTPTDLSRDAGGCSCGMISRWSLSRRRWVREAPHVEGRNRLSSLANEVDDHVASF
jgi:hypothetical protein